MLFRYTEKVSAFQIGILTEEMAVLHIPVLSVSSAVPLYWRYIVDVTLANHVRYRIFPKSWVHRPRYTHISLHRQSYHPFLHNSDRVFCHMVVSGKKASYSSWYLRKVFGSVYNMLSQTPMKHSAWGRCRMQLRSRGYLQHL